MTFLEKLTDTIYARYGEDISKICFVLPNRRAGLYLKKYLALKIKKAIWAPSIFSIEDFVCHITGLQKADPTELLFDFYNIYVSFEGEKAQSFEEFMNWAQILISDYNDADMNLADTVALFQYLNEAKAISKWNLEITPLTKHESDYLRFYNSLSKYYTRLTTHLLAKNIAYQGLIYKKAAENIDEYVKKNEYSNIIFAGFNALTASEEKIIKTLSLSAKAEIFWDADNYYVNNRNQEAGTFIRKFKDDWGLKDFNWIDDSFATDEKNITITGVPLHIGQAELAGQLLSEMTEELANSENTALVLADESLLIPMLYAIPENVKDINITMGYPLKDSPVHSLFSNVFTLHENSKKYSSANTIRFYQKDIVNLFNHPYFRLISSNSKDTFQTSKFLDSLKTNRIFQKQEEIINELKDTFAASFFNNVNDNPLLLLEMFVLLIGHVRDTLIANKKYDQKNSDIDIEYLFHYAVIITKIRNLLNEYHFIKDIKTLRKIFTGLVETSTIPFYGEPLKGLQIMGMLETRSLDFENIILLSVNENILPAGKFQSTFVPHDIRKEMGLDTYKQKESIFAYHFYRLLQRAKNVQIIYNTQTNDFGSGEKSRFLTQIIKELPVYNSKIKIEEKLLINENSLSGLDEPIIISKSEEIIDELKMLAEKGISPSAMNTYISCSLRFYFQYVEKIEEIEETAETIDAATLGSTVHYVLQELYKEYVAKVVNAEDIRKMPALVEKLTEEGFIKNYPQGDIKTGKNLLIAKVAIKFIQNFLQQEAKFLEDMKQSNKYLSIVGLEERCETNIHIKTNTGEAIPIKVKGFIDRVDLVDGALRIIDYKTGLINKNELKFDSWEELISEPKLAKSLQLLTYAYLYNKKHNSENVSTGIITFRNMSKGFLSVSCPESTDSIIYKQKLEKIEEALISLISEIFNNKIPFAQTDDLAICRNCPFAGVCNR